MNLQKTKDYDRFENDTTNRNVTSIRKLVSSMEKYGFIPAYPIHVVPHNGKYTVRDGGHRLEAARATGEPVYFVVCDKNDISIPEINDAARHWSSKDYVDSYVRAGNQEYAILKKFSDQHGLGVLISAQLLAGKNASKSDVRVYSSVKDGTFKVVGYQYAHKVASIINALSSAIKVARHASFVSALSKVVTVKGFDCNRFIKNANRLCSSFTVRATIEDYLTLIEDVYNDHARYNRLPVKFLAQEKSKENSLNNLKKK